MRKIKVLDYIPEKGGYIAVGLRHGTGLLPSQCLSGQMSLLVRVGRSERQQPVCPWPGPRK